MRQLFSLLVRASQSLSGHRRCSSMPGWGEGKPVVAQFLFQVLLLQLSGRKVVTETAEHSRTKLA